MLSRSFMSASSAPVRAFYSKATIDGMFQTLSEVAAAAPKAARPTTARQPTRSTNIVGIRNSALTATSSIEAGNNDRAVNESWLQKMLPLISSKHSSALTVIRKWKQEGHVVKKDELCDIILHLSRMDKPMCCHGLEMCAWLAQQKDIELQPMDFATHLDLIGKVRGSACAEIFFKAMPKSMRRARAFLALLQTYVRENKIRKAEALTAKMAESGFLNKAYHFNPILSLYYRNRRVNKFFETIKALKSNKAMVPNYQTYKLWLRACASQNDIQGAEKAFAEMKTGDIKTGVVAHAILASLYIKNNQLDAARRIISEMEGVKNRNRPVSFRKLLSLYARVGDTEKAFEIWDKMKSEFGSTVHSDYTLFMSALVKCNLLEKAEDLFKEWALNFKIKTSELPNILLSAYVNGGRLEMADKFYSRMLRSGVEVTDMAAKKILIRGFLKERRRTREFETIRRGIGYCGRNQRLLRLVYRSIEEDADMAGAEHVLKMVRKLGCVDSNTYKCLIRCYSKEGEMGRILPKIKTRMECDHVAMDDEIRRLLG